MTRRVIIPTKKRGGRRATASSACTWMVDGQAADTRTPAGKGTTHAHLGGTPNLFPVVLPLLTKKQN